MRIDLGQENDEPEIGLIALIDCIFFLLMFFMVATSFKQQVGQKEARELPIVLPSSDASLRLAEATTAEPLVVGVDAQGQFYVGAQRLSVQQLHERLRAEARAAPHRPVRIEGDRRTSYQHIVHVLDLCAFEGLKQVSLRTRP
jgi:biopolymer transport protein ExbD